MAPSTDYGLVRVGGALLKDGTEAGGKQLYFKHSRILRADAKGGDVEITLVNGKVIRVYHEAVLRWPSNGVEVE